LPDDETERFDEPWRGDEHPPFSESLADDVSFEAEEERHPLLQKAMDLFVRLDSLFHNAVRQQAPPLRTLYQGAGDVMGGLAQALSQPHYDAEEYGLRVVQLKRALRGAAFARGALFPLRASVSKEQFRELFDALQQMETDIVSELGKVRSEHDRDDG
jgi:hypothetical protein